MHFLMSEYPVGVLTDWYGSGFDDKIKSLLEIVKYFLHVIILFYFVDQF